MGAGTPRTTVSRPRRAAGALLWGVRANAFLLGFGLSLGVLGYARVFQSIFEPARLVVFLVLATALASAAAAPWGARRIAMVIVRARRGPEVFALDAHSAADELSWILQSVLGVSLAVLMLAGLAVVAGVRQVWAVASVRFFWTPVTEGLCLGLMIFATLGLVGFVAGLQLVGLYSAVSRSRSAVGGLAGAETGGIDERGIPGVAASLLTGIAAAVAVYGARGLTSLSAEQWILLGAVPLFTVSVLSASITRHFEAARGCGGSRCGTAGEAGPVCSGGRNPVELILASILAWGVSVGLCLSAWSAHGSAAFTSIGVHPLAWAMGAMATGAWLAGWPASRCRKYSMGGSGVALWLAGTVVLVAVAVTGAVPEIWHDSWLLVTGACLGHALPYARRALAVHSVTERQGSARWMAAALCGVLVGAGAYQWGADGPGWDTAAASAACLLLLIFGGLLQIHEQEGVRRVRQRRLGLVFTSLGLAVMALPAGARRAAMVVGKPDHTAVHSPSYRASSEPPDIVPAVDSGPLVAKTE
ncbi:MAG: hypothetical protein JXA69_02460 [Phycisphaerae bacterium]|nr:hypothetical protein [Phycisphaerae bacterium]